MRISEETLSALENNDERVKQLILRDEIIDSPTFGRIVNIAIRNTHLEVLSLTRAGLTDENVIKLMTALQANVDNKLKFVSLSGNKLGDKIVASVKSFLEKSVVLQKFSLAHNNLNEESIKIILDARLGNQASQTGLDFTGNPGATAIVIKRVTGLLISCSTPSPRSKQFFFPAVVHSTEKSSDGNESSLPKTLTSEQIEKTLGCFENNRNEDKTELNLSGIKLTTEVFSRVKMIIITNRYLKKLNLTDTQLISSQVMELVQTLNRSQVTNLVELVLCKNNLTDLCAPQLSNLLKDSITIEILDIRDNALTDIGIEQLANGYKRNRHSALNNLFVEGNNYTSKSDVWLDELYVYGVKTLHNQTFVRDHNESIDYQNVGSFVSVKKYNLTGLMAHTGHKKNKKVSFADNSDCCPFKQCCIL